MKLALNGQDLSDWYCCQMANLGCIKQRPGFDAMADACKILKIYAQKYLLAVRKLENSIVCNNKENMFSYATQSCVLYTVVCAWRRR